MTNSPFSLNDKLFLVTGASSGIGKKVCQAIAECNGRFIAVSRREELLKMLVNSTPGDHAHYVVDLTDKADIALLVNNLGKIDGLVHCAGTTKLLPLGYYNDADYENITGTNIDSIIYLMNLLVKKRKLNKESSVVLISSLITVISGKGGGIYASTKGALNAIAKVWANELASGKIRVNCVAPGIVKTDLVDEAFEKLSQTEIEADIKKYPLGYGTVADVAYPIVFLLSPAGKWITGQTILLDGGRSI
jgi:NAD(P)-dependent dehydrogenase (short-subunit alcohol dehydrogenase family)